MFKTSINSSISAWCMIRTSSKTGDVILFDDKFVRFGVYWPELRILREFAPALKI